MLYCNLDMGYLSFRSFCEKDFDDVLNHFRQLTERFLSNND
jgi:hypothetical protein